MRAVAGSFGLPPTKVVKSSETQPAADGIQLLLLSVSMDRGGFHQLAPLACGISEDDLQKYLEQWLSEGNRRASFVRAELKTLPFVEHHA